MRVCILLTALWCAVGALCYWSTQGPEILCDAGTAQHAGSQAPATPEELALSWYEVLAQFEAPADGLPTRFEWTDTLSREDRLGETLFDGKAYIVRLRSDLPMDRVVPVLLHEWAHVRTMRVEFQNQDSMGGHGPHWGVEFARLWRISQGDV